MSEQLIELVAEVIADESGKRWGLTYAKDAKETKEVFRRMARDLLAPFFLTHLIVPKTTFDGEENTVITKSEYDRLSDENNALWAIFKTCPGCKRLVPGMAYGCDIQHHIDLSGNCNQKEELPWGKAVYLMERFVNLMDYMTPSNLPDNYSTLQGLMNDFAEILGEVSK